MSIDMCFLYIVALKKNKRSYPLIQGTCRNHFTLLCILDFSESPRSDYAVQRVKPYLLCFVGFIAQS